LQQYPTIRGILAKTPYGRHAILLDAFLTRSSLTFGGTGLASAEYRAKCVLLSHEELDNPNREFQQIWFGLTYLPAWWPMAGLRTNIDDAGGGAMTWPSPETWEANTDAGRLDFRTRWRCKAHAISGASVSPQCYVYVHLSQGQRIDRLRADVVRPIQNPLTFLTDRPNGIWDLSFSDGSSPAFPADEPVGYSLVYAPTPFVAPPDDLLLPDDVLVVTKDIEDFQSLIGMCQWV